MTTQPTAQPSGSTGKIARSAGAVSIAVMADPRQMGKLAVRTDAEELGSFRREFALPPGELEDFRISDGGEIHRVEEQDDPGPLVVGQLDLPERRPHDR